MTSSFEGPDARDLVAVKGQEIGLRGAAALFSPWLV